MRMDLGPRLDRVITLPWSRVCIYIRSVGASRKTLDTIRATHFCGDMDIGTTVHDQVDIRKHEFIGHEFKSVG